MDEDPKTRAPDYRALDFADELPTPTEFQDSQDNIAKTWLQMLAISERPTRDIRRPSVHQGASSPDNPETHENAAREVHE